MANQLFNELVKLASEKIARGWQGGGGRYGGMGRFGGGNVYIGRGGYMGPHPAMMPGIVESQRVGVQGQRQMLPEEVNQRKQQQQFQDLGISGFHGSSEGKEMLRHQNELIGATSKHQQATDKHTQLGIDLETLKGQRDAARQSLMGTAGGEGRLNQLEGNGDFMSGFTSNLAKLTGFGSAEAKAYADAKGKYEAAQRSHTSASTAYARQAQDYESVRRAHEKNIGEYQGKMKEYSTQGRQDLADRARSRGPGGAAGGMPNQRAQPEPKAIPVPNPNTVAPPATHAPGGGLKAPTPIPRGTGPAGGPANVVEGAVFMPFTSVDNLIQHAARNMFDRYVKVAQAKLAVDSTRNRPIASLPGLPPHAKPNSPKHVPFSTGTWKGKSQKKANSMMGLDPAVAAALAGRGKFHLGDSSVNLGPDVAGVGSGAAPTPQGMDTTAPATITRSAAQQAQEAAKALKAQQKIADTQAREQMKMLRQAQQVHHGAIQAEQKAFTALHGPKPGAGSEFFRAKSMVPEVG
jgi:hypothetical protein